MQKIKDLTKFCCLSGNQLKIFAAIIMTIDHIGAYIFTDILILRIIGRIAFPIFAFMIAEGCCYTKNPKRYFGVMAALALFCQIFYFAFTSSKHQSILVTFSLSIALIFSVKAYMKDKTVKNAVFAFAAFSGIYILTAALPAILKNGFSVDYGFLGVMVPVMVFLGKTHRDKMIMLAAALVLLSAAFGGIQWFSLFALIPLSMYSGKRGKVKMKYFFYIYYPLHLAIIYLAAKIFV